MKPACANSSGRSAVCRSVAAQVARGKTEHVNITPAVVAELLGPARYLHDTKLAVNKPGVVTGLAYTPAGGEVMHIEATRYPGKGNITLTGQIGNVMKESMQAALSLVRSRDGQVGATPKIFARWTFTFMSRPAPSRRMAPRPEWRCSPRSRPFSATRRCDPMRDDR